MSNYTLPAKPIQTYPATPGNQITRDYYNSLVGGINGGTIHKAVLRVEDRRWFLDIRYYLISVRG